MTGAADSLRELTTEQRRQFDWLDYTYLKKIVAALEAAESGSTRYVGGCVRDTLMGAAPKDFDVATTLEPDAVVAALKAAGLRSAPTGIDHGTITAIADHHGVEITTLRADISTDGRRATVAFTKDWRIDATRRDFRVNAIYLTPDGKLFDPVGGVDDAANRRVCFIGKAEERIREDYLRILRFFRFSARFAESFDSVGLAACAKLREGIETLSAERIGAEFTAILSLPRAAIAIETMHKECVLKQIWQAEPAIDVLSELKSLSPEAPAPLGLAALYGDDGEGIENRLRLPNADKFRRKHALARAKEVTPGLSEKAVQAMIYRHGEDVFHDALLLARARTQIDEKQYASLRKLAERWTAPVFPISGKDIVAKGVDAGPAVSEILSEIEEQWIAEEFPDEARAREILAAKVDKYTYN